MKPDWDKLAELFKDSPLVTVYDVDCTAGGKDLCSHVGVRGYPTIKYWQPDSDEAQDYKGGRGFDQMKTFTDTTFQASCNVDTLDNCNDDQKKIIGELKGKDAAAIQARAKEIKGKLESTDKSLREHERNAASKKAELEGEIKNIKKTLSMVKKILKAGGHIDKHDEL